jgi:signal transduction histidine kinase
MKIADKVKLLVIPLVLIPFLIILCGSIFFGRIYIRNIYGAGHSGGLQPYANPILAMNGAAEMVLSELQDELETNPDKFLNLDYLNGIENQLKDYDVDFWVKIDGDIYYRSIEENDELEKLLPDYGDNDQIEGGLFVDAENPFYLRQQDFELSDGRTGSIFIVTYTETLARNMRRVLVELVLMVAGVLMLISGFISIYIYVIFVRPLTALQEGTERIKEGNLEEDVVVMSDDEIGQVCQSFNEMRVKLKESVDDRMQQEQENRELISNISHDLRTPITAIKGYVEGIMDGVADTPEKMDRYIKTIYNKANELDALINELSLYSKIDNNSIPYNFVKLKVESYFDDCIEDVTMDMEHASVELTYENLCESNTRIIADPEQIRRVIGNIITNAVKYNKKQERRIDIRVQPYEDDQISIGIRDNGNGISAEDLPKIFKRMYRTDSSRNSSTGGSGLGLSIARKIVEEHGGKIWAESEEGKGTLITFTLKIYVEDSQEEMQ